MAVSAWSIAVALEGAGSWSSSAKRSTYRKTAARGLRISWESPAARRPRVAKCWTGWASRSRRGRPAGAGVVPLLVGGPRREAPEGGEVLDALRFPFESLALSHVVVERRHLLLHLPCEPRLLLLEPRIGVPARRDVFDREQDALGRIEAWG